MNKTKALYWITILSASALITGCGVSQFAPSPSGAAPQVGGFASHGRSWMDAGASKYTLLYVSGGNGTVNVYRYWQRNQIGTLTDFQQPTGMCVDNEGDVYITDYSAGRIFEYAHGATKPIRTLTESGNPYACAVDLQSGNLAVANEHQGVFVYPQAKGRAHIFTDRALDAYAGVAYDNRGNLLVTDGCPYYSSCYGSGFAFLRKGGVHLNNVYLAGSSYGLFYGGAAGLQWDGNDFVIDLHEIYRLVVSGNKAKVTSETLITPTLSNLAWIYSSDPRLLRGTQVVGVTSKGIDFWKYPQGGSPIAEIGGTSNKPYAVAISLKSGAPK